MQIGNIIYLKSVNFGAGKHMKAHELEKLLCVKILEDNIALTMENYEERIPEFDPPGWQRFRIPLGMHIVFGLNNVATILDLMKYHGKIKTRNKN